MSENTAEKPPVVPIPTHVRILRKDVDDLAEVVARWRDYHGGQIANLSHRLAALEQREARREKPACTCDSKPGWHYHHADCPTVADKVAAMKASQPQPGAGVEKLAVDDDSILCIMQKEIRDSGATKLRYLHARDAQIAAAARAKAIEDIEQAMCNHPISIDEICGFNRVRTLIRTLKEQG